MKFPNYIKNENSPELNASEPGISIHSMPAVKLGEHSCFPVYGSFNIKKSLLYEFEGHVMEAVVILLRGPYPATKSVGYHQVFFKDDVNLYEDSIYGFFNIDLFSFFNLEEVPNRYFVNASIFNYVSQILTVDVLE